LNLGIKKPGASTIIDNLNVISAATLNLIHKAQIRNANFAKPYHSWERSQNENANGLLGFKTPYEVFEANAGIKMKSVFEIALMT